MSSALRQAAVAVSRRRLSSGTPAEPLAPPKPKQRVPWGIIALPGMCNISHVTCMYTGIYIHVHDVLATLGTRPALADLVEPCPALAVLEKRVHV
jgi:hypothetical protein